MATFTLQSSSNDSLFGGTGNDVFTVNASADLDGNDTVIGNAGQDTILVTEASSTILTAQLAGVSGVEALVYSKTVGDVALAAFTGGDFGAAGLRHIDAHLVTGLVRIDAEDVTAGLVIDGGRGVNIILGSGQNDIFRIDAATFGADDNIGGFDHAAPTFFPDLDNRLGDVLQLTSDAKSMFVTDAQFGSIFDMQTLSLSGKAGFNVTLDGEAGGAGIHTVDASAATGAVTIDVSALAGMTVDFTSKGLTAADKVIGHGDTILGITDKAAVSDAAWKGISGVEEIDVFGHAATPDYTGAKLALGANAHADSINTVRNLTDYALTVDASGHAFGAIFFGNIGDDVLIGQGGDSFFGGAGNDSLHLGLKQLDSVTLFQGGTGTDEIRITDSSTVKDAQTIIDLDFSQVQSVERLAFDGTGHQEVTLAGDAETAGLLEVDASKVSGGLTLDAADMENTALKVIAGTGADSILLGGNQLTGVTGSVFIASKSLNGADILQASLDQNGDHTAELHLTDAVKLADTFFTPLATANLINGFGTLDLDSGAAKQSLVAGGSLATFLDNSGIGAIAATTGNTASGFTFDFSKFQGLNGDLLTVTGGAGNDVFIGGPDGNVSFVGGEDDDTFKFSSAFFGAPPVSGGGGTDTLVVTDGGSIADGSFQRAHSIEILQLAAAKAAYSVQIGGLGSIAGLGTIDGSQAGVDVGITIASTSDFTLIAGAKNNTFTGGAGADTFKIAAGTFNTGDAFDGFGGAGDNTLQFTTGGAVGKGGKFENISLFQLSDAGNSFKLADVDPASSFGNAVTLNFAGAGIGGVTAIVNDGKGNDTVDFSLLSGQALGFVSSGGNDTFIGGIGSQNFYAFAPGTLTGADKVIGNAYSPDVVLVESGSYSSDQFKGFKSVDILVAESSNPGAASNITIKNDFFATVDTGASGTKTFQILTGNNSANDVVDASGVTGAFNGVSIASAGGDDRLTGGAGQDSFNFTDRGNGFGLESRDVIAGRGGLDELNLTANTGAALVDDGDLENVTGVEEILVGTDSSGAVTLNLGPTALAAGIETVTQGNGVALTVDASGFSSDFNHLEGLTINGGNGDLALTLSAGVDTVVFADNTLLDANDAIDGGGFYSQSFGKTDRIVFEGAADITDAQFAQVTNMPVVALAGQANTITLGNFADKAGILKVDASQAGQAVFVDASAMKNGITIIGSKDSDALIGGDGDDLIYGGGGQDFVNGGKGSDTFVYRTAADSMLLASGNDRNVDVIFGFDSTDKFDLSAFGFAVDKTDEVIAAASIVFVDTAGFFEGKAVAVATDGSIADLYIDANGNGDFDVGSDLFIEFANNATTDLENINAYIFNGPVFDPGLPFLGQETGNKIASLTPPGTYTDADLSALSPAGTLQLAAGKGDWTVALGKNSEVKGYSVLDATAATGKVTIDATDRVAGILIEAGKGVNTLTGGHGDDRFVFQAGTLDAKDGVIGGPGQDVLQYVGSTGKSGLLDVAFSNVRGVEILDFAADPTVIAPNPVDLTGQKVVLGVLSDAAGITRVINGDTFGFGMTVDASGRADGVRFDGNAGNDTFIASKGADFFDAGNGNDIMSFKLGTFDGNDIFLGGLGTDEMHFVDSFDAVKNPFAITDGRFQGTYSIERLVFDGTGKQIVTLGGNAEATLINTVDASKVAGGLTLDASGMTNTALKVIAGTGADTITLGGGALSSGSTGEVFMTTKTLTSADTLTGQFPGGAELHFTDAVHLTDAYFGGLKDKNGDFHISNFLSLQLDNSASGQTLVFGQNFSDLTLNDPMSSVIANSADAKSSFTFDFTNYHHQGSTFGMFIIGGAGNDVFLPGANDGPASLAFQGQGGDDSFRFASANFDGKDPIDGGDGNDEIVLLDAASPVDDTDFQNVASVETLRLGPTKSVGYDVNLGPDSDLAGITTIDARLAGVAVGVDATNANNDLIFLAGTKDNLFTGGGGHDTFKIDAKSFNGNDLVAASSISGKDDTLEFSTGGAVTASAFGGVSGIEILRLSNAGNSVTLSDQLVGSADVNHSTLLPNGIFADFTVIGGTGSDKVDLSLLTDAGEHVFVNLGTGKDQVIGSLGDDFFQFSDLTSADLASGGDGHDIVFVDAGKYAATVFKGFSSIEELLVGSGDSTVALHNDAFKGADLQGDGTRAWTVDFLGVGSATVDASAVTAANDRVTAIFDHIGNDTFIGGAGADTIGFTDQGVGFGLDGNDHLAGGLGRDTLLLTATTDGDSVSDADLAGLSSIERLAVDVTTNSGDTAHVLLAANALAAGIVEVDASVSKGNLQLDATGYDGGLLVTSGLGDDNLNLGNGDDTVRFLNGALSSNDVADAHAGNNTLELVGGTTENDASFSQISHFQTLKLTDGSFDITFDSHTNDFDFVDGSAAGHGLTFTATAGHTSSLFVSGSDFADKITTSSGGDFITGGPGGDTLKGGSGGDHFIYNDAGDSFLQSGNVTTNVDTIQDYLNGTDVIDLRPLDLVSAAIDQIGTGDLTALSAAASISFGSGNGVAVGDNGIDATFIFADANGNGAFDLNTDVVIKLTGTDHAAALASGGIFA